MRRRVRLIHWNAAEAGKRASRLRAAGYDVAAEPLTPAALRELRDDPPAAVVIDLARLPSQGRDVALAIRQYKATGHVPLIFVDGDPDKVARTRDLLPDATYTTWGRLRSSLKRAIAHPPADPVVPGSVMAGYSGTPLLKKLGIKANSVVAPPWAGRVILVDTSVWIDHLRTGDQRLKSLLHDEQVLTHPLVVGELVCGSVRNRDEILSLLITLPEAQVAKHHEVLSFIESRRLYGRGIGWVDAHLLASALLSSVALWTLDRPFAKVASALKVSP